jgi:hypothetical protein
VKAAEFAIDWRAWWVTIQPSWRSGESGSGPLDQECPANADWKVLQRGGSNGIFIILMCLTWWGKAATTPQDRDAFTTAVEDVAWVFEKVLISIHVRRR